MFFNFLYPVIFAVGAAAVYLVNYGVPGSRAKDLPPGPPTIPILGNLHQIPKTGAHFKFSEWARQYGGIFSLKLGSTTTIVITSPYLVKQLFDKKASQYSDRPSNYIANSLVVKGNHVLFYDYGDRWRRARKIYHQQLMERRCDELHIDLLNAEANQLLRDILMDPENLMKHPKRFSNSTIMSLLFGMRTPTITTPHMVALYKIMDELSEVFEVGAAPPVDIFPLTKYLPQTFFKNWKTRARHLSDSMHTLYNNLVQQTIERRGQTGTRGSLLDNVLDSLEKSPMPRAELEFLCGSLLEAGSDTTASMILAFIHAMIRCPEAQRQAQREIDSVMDEHRTPTWADYKALPYVAMIVKETMRWRPVTVTAFPHRATKDDVIDGMLIPKDSTVILNIWGLHHDPERHLDHDRFDPQRFAGRTLLASEYANSADYKNRDHHGYGAGRRICPGIHLAERNMFLAMAKILWAYDISEKLDHNGKPIPIDMTAETGYSSGFLQGPKDFEASLKIRSEKRKETILEEFSRAEEIFHKYRD